MQENNEKLNYIRKLYAQENDLLQEIDAKIKEIDLPIHIAPEEGRLIQILMKLINAKKVLEIGTLFGYSTLWLAEALSEDGEIYTIEKDISRANTAINYCRSSSLAHKINILQGDARDLLEKLLSLAPFDLMFIDADKRSYPIYLEFAEKIIRKGGVIVADNTLLFDAVFKEGEKHPKVKPSTIQAMREFNLYLADKSKFDTILLPTEKGLTIAIKKA